MKQIIFIVSLFLFINFSLLAQKNEPVKVKAGTQLRDYFEPCERYLYADFTGGKAAFKNGKTYDCLFNYNFLSGEMEFIKLKDTLVVTDKDDLKSIVVRQDTFYYENGYLHQIQNGYIKVYSKQFMKIKDIQKKGAMGTINRSAAQESYDFYSTSALSYDLVTDTDIVLQKEEVFFFSTSPGEYSRFNRKNISTHISITKDLLKNYIKSNKVNFKSKEDLLQLADYMNEVLGGI